MRVLLVTQTFPKYPGDATAPFMAEIAESLASRGHTIDVVLPHHPEFRYPAGGGIRFFPYRYSPTDRISPWGYGESLRGSSRVTPTVLGFLPAIVISLRRKLRQLLAASSYDVIHAHWLLPNGWAAAAARHQVPLVITLHGSDVAIAERNRVSQALARRALAAAGAVTAVSDDLRLRAVVLGADPATARTVHLGVNTEEFAPRSDNSATRIRLGAAPEQLLVVAVGRLIEKKGFSYLIEACSQLEAVHVVIVGDGYLRAELERLARDRGGSVTFTGTLDRGAVAEAVAAADVVAVPSVIDSVGKSDGLPNTILEALSAGRAVVASRIAGIPEVVTEDSNGLLVTEKDVNGLVRALSALKDPGLRERLGGEARRRATSELGWDKTAAAFEQAFVIAGAGPRPGAPA